MRVLAIGDIHGCSAALKALVAALDLGSDDVVITLGDYVDRGPDSKGVIDFLLQLQSAVQLVPLRGNHEIMMLHAYKSREEILFWLRCGGDATLSSYGAETMHDIPKAHWEFLESTLPWFETASHFFVHANALADVPLAEQPEEVLYWQHLPGFRLRKPKRHMSGKVMVCGHTSQTSGKVLDLGSVICIDTFAHGGKWLTCLEPASGHFWQGNEHGEVRDDWLRH